MTAKKNIIQQLRKEAKELNTTIKNQKIAIRRLERRVEHIKKDHFMQLEHFADNVDGLRKLFNKELAWQALSPNPEGQLYRLNLVTKSIRRTVDYTNEHYINTHSLSGIGRGREGGCRAWRALP